MQLGALGEAQHLAVVLDVIFDAVVHIGDFADVVLVVFHAEVLDQLIPSPQHQLPRLRVVQLHF